MNVDEAASSCRSVLDEVSETVITDEYLLETVMTAIIGDGHVLLEDVPGTGKTLTA